MDLAQPDNIKEPEFLDRIRQLRPTTAVVVAFGQIFPKSLLDLPDRGCINIHASLLPRHRGAAPIQTAIVAGDEVTGVTTMLMDEGLDTGPILLQERVEIGAEETAGELAERLAVFGGRLLIETLDRWGPGLLEPRPQPQEGVTVARRLRRSDGIVDWSARAHELFNRLRGLSPWPGISTLYQGHPLKILWGRPVFEVADGDEKPGTILGIQGDLIWVRCGGGAVFGLERVQKAGRRALSAKDFANGERLEPGVRLG